MAAGLSLPAEHFPAFKRRFLKTFTAQRLPFPRGEVTEIAQSLTIAEVNLELVRDIARLAPFGPGNPALNFLVENVRVVSQSLVGIEREHCQVTVADRDNNELRLIWWNGADTPLPKVQFDLVCKLTESDYRGIPQLSAEWIDFRLSAAGKEEIAARQIKIVDCRNLEDKQAGLASLAQEHPYAVIWGEGELTGGALFRGRHKLERSSHLAIWTTPPSQAVLRTVLDQTHANQVTVFAVDPGSDDLESFMSRLGGVVKYALTGLGGTVQLDRLGAACAVDEMTVRTGVLLWQARGEFSVVFVGETVHFSAEKPDADPGAIEHFEALLKELLAESRAYRGYFHKGDLASIITPSW